MTTIPKTRPARIQIQNVWPTIDCGRFPVKRSLGDAVDVYADVFCDGHDVVRAVVRYRPPGTRRFLEAPMEPLGSDRWHGIFQASELGRWQFTVTAWVDRFASWQHEVRRKVDAGQTDLASELLEGAVLLGVDSLTLEAGLAAVPAAKEPRRGETSILPLELIVDRDRARFGCWYELFPRSWGGFAGVEAQLPAFAELGVDVLYLPPIHPIGRSHRKGKSGSLVAGPDDPGSPWAIGSSEGGHRAIDPGLGTIGDFDRLVAAAAEHGIDIALDFAIQCSPDHPWLEEHPEWFHRRPDGTLKYAENPPKRYQDIYNVNFESDDWQTLWAALLDVVLHWVSHGVKAFRVDNPHTKPVAFWEWLIREVQAVDPEVIFLSEAFTRPSMLTTLAKAGFSQSYTYFTWKNAKWELNELVGELAFGGWTEFLRPNFFANTPDILHEYLQRGGRPAFEARLVLAATLSPSYGIYSGFEHCENVPLADGSEEYLNSEKYEIKERSLDGPLLPLLARLNTARRENPALQRLDNVTLLETESDHLYAFAKRSERNTIVICVNLDPAEPHEGVAVVPAALGLPPTFRVRDLLDDSVYTWHVGRNYVRLEPGTRQAHVLRAEV
jgi:starch synthase (maltosyl-transferring)